MTERRRPRRGRRTRAAVAAAFGRQDHVIRRHYEARVTRLPEGTPPIRIAHLTDLHVGRVTPEARLRAAVDAANAFEPDLICLTGDYIAHSLRYLNRLTACLKHLEAPAVATMGNHDHWHGADAVGEALERAGIEVLWNASTTQTLRGLRWRIVGLDDAVTGHHDVERAFREARADEPTLMLSHLAEMAPVADERGVALVLSGHTHGGQVKAGGITPRVMKRMGHEYLMGWYVAGQTPVYVNRGIGAAVFPWRDKHAHAEVAEIELIPGSEGQEDPLSVEVIREAAHRHDPGSR